MINEPNSTPLPQAHGKPATRRFFVSRHPGAIEWAKKHHWAVCTQFVSHLEIEQIAAGDIVIGTLPVHLAAEVCARGARYLHLSLALTAGQRGTELTAQELEAADACLVQYQVISNPRPLISSCFVINHE